MESIGNWQGQDDVYRRTGYDTRGNANTLFYYARRPDGVWLSWHSSNRKWEELNDHQASVIRANRDRALTE